MIEISRNDPQVDWGIKQSLVCNKRCQSVSRKCIPRIVTTPRSTWSIDTRQFSTFHCIYFSFLQSLFRKPERTLWMKIPLHQRFLKNHDQLTWPLQPFSVQSPFNRLSLKFCRLSSTSLSDFKVSDFCYVIGYLAIRVNKCLNWCTYCNQVAGECMLMFICCDNFKTIK